MVADEVLEIVLLEKAVSVEALKKQLIFADKIDEFKTLANQYSSQWLITHFLKLFYCDL